MHFSDVKFPGNMERTELVRWALKENVPLHELENYLDSQDAARTRSAPARSVSRSWFPSWLFAKPAA